jgi:hypothetical protein
VLDHRVFGKELGGVRKPPLVEAGVILSNEFVP